MINILLKMYLHNLEIHSIRMYVYTFIVFYISFVFRRNLVETDNHRVICRS